MKVVAIYRSNSEHGTQIEDFLRDFNRQTGKEIETLNPDEREGESFCRAYDIVEYPSMIALSDDGRLQHFWKGMPLPTISELSYYA